MALYLLKDGLYAILRVSPISAPPSVTCALRLAKTTAPCADYPSISFETAAGAYPARLLTYTFTKQATLPASNSPTAAQVIPRNFSP